MNRQAIMNKYEDKLFKIIIFTFLAFIIVLEVVLGVARAETSVSNGVSSNIGYVIATIPVGKGPKGIIYDPSNGYIYVANSNSNTVSVIDPRNNSVIATIPVGQQPTELLYVPSNGYIYVTNFWSNTVSVINPTNNSVIKNITVGLLPVGMTYDPLNGYIYVTNAFSYNVSIIDSKNNALVGNIDLGLKRMGLILLEPWGITYDPKTGYIYVVDDHCYNCGPNALSIIDPNNNSVIATILIEEGSINIFYNPSNGYLYLTTLSSIVVYNATTTSIMAIAEISIPYEPAGPPELNSIAYDLNNGYLYVTDFLNNTVVVIDPDNNSFIGAIKVGSNPWGIAYDPDNGYLYVTNYGSNSVSVIATPVIHKTTTNTPVTSSTSKIRFILNNQIILVTLATVITIIIVVVVVIVVILERTKKRIR